MVRKWHITKQMTGESDGVTAEEIVRAILEDRGITTPKEREAFLHPSDPISLTASDVGVNKSDLTKAIARIQKAIKDKESVVVYADYDADGITAGAIMWETLWRLGARVMPYIPHRVDEGYGLSEKGIDAVRVEYDPSLIITVDHGITAHAQVEYAKKLGIEVIITDHHVKPEKLPRSTIVHTTLLSGSGVSWFVATQMMQSQGKKGDGDQLSELTALAAIGTIADLLPLTGVNRSIVKFGLEMLRKTKRTGLNALIAEAGIEKKSIDTFSVSHMLAPRLNAMGRLEHAIDALRLLCTKDEMKAKLLAQKLGLTNKERQQLTIDTVTHAKDLVPKTLKKLLFIAHETYNPGVIGLVAGRLVEEYWRPAIVLSVGAEFAKASARSIPGFNIVEAIRTCSDLLVDVGGHPMAAGFTVETKNLDKLKKRLEVLAEKELDDEKLKRTLHIDVEIPLSRATETLWLEMQSLRPFGFGNYEPVFATRGVKATDVRIIGATKKHLKLKILPQEGGQTLDAVAFNMAGEYGKLASDTPVDVAYAIDMNEWNGKRTLQLKVKDILISE
ncbi:MAG: single-stranded-DNA-specific exonuclease RecJ [Patescibacteria group bacterium]